jgi:hypothetical protein
MGPCRSSPINSNVVFKDSLPGLRKFADKRRTMAQMLLVIDQPFCALAGQGFF